jgi:hypothetical protein
MGVEATRRRKSRNSVGEEVFAGSLSLRAITLSFGGKPREV